ncbi:hypothetical protein JTF06_09185 [Desemzia sp. RIT804]|uniref:hypothetical protein n=1 Tax=Desemzia sp. RIT 804 TaxID=2810209 RepID=UPI001950EBE7|nr:hypothetical protein [Desemzia sp. RIT 804]MBM6615057.1 hypothetical protein [Desemzia sp. RIT 804]
MGPYRAMVEYYHQGKIWVIGVSNFYRGQLFDLAEFPTIVSAINQIELHPLYQQNTLKKVI